MYDIAFLGERALEAKTDQSLRAPIAHETTCSHTYRQGCKHTGLDVQYSGNTGLIQWKQKYWRAESICKNFNLGICGWVGYRSINLKHWSTLNYPNSNHSPSYSYRQLFSHARAHGVKWSAVHQLSCQGNSGQQWSIYSSATYIVDMYVEMDLNAIWKEAAGTIGYSGLKPEQVEAMVEFVSGKHVLRSCNGIWEEPYSRPITIRIRLSADCYYERSGIQWYFWQINAGHFKVHIVACSAGHQFQWKGVS